MAIPDKSERPGEAGARPGQNPATILSDDSLEHVTGGICGPEEDVPPIDGSNIRPDSPETADPLEQINAAAKSVIQKL